MSRPLRAKPGTVPVGGPGASENVEIWERAAVSPAPPIGHRPFDSGPSSTLHVHLGAHAPGAGGARSMRSSISSSSSRLPSNAALAPPPCPACASAMSE
eukprot:2197318-Prymnesium_polylepis.2